MANEPKKYGHITRDERVIIDHLLEQKVKPAEIARQLGRTRSTISREIKRNTIRRGPGKGRYFRIRSILVGFIKREELAGNSLRRFQCD